MEPSVLSHITKAPSKDFVRKILVDAFMFKEKDSLTNQNTIKLLSNTLEIDQTISEKLLKELSKSVKQVIFEGLSDTGAIQAIFDASLGDDLKKILANLILEQLPKLKKFIVDNQSIVPRLIDFDWRVDIKMQRNLGGTDSKSNTSGQQTCILQFQNETTSNNGVDAQAKSTTVTSNKLEEYFIKNFAKMGKKQLGLLSFVARVHANDKCGNNGLPLTPNSIRSFGRFQYLKYLNHKNLCRYVDIQRGSHDRLNVISEAYSLKLTDLMADSYMYNLITIDSNRIYKWIFEILDAFKYLHEKNIVIKCFHIKNLLITSELELKIGNYGLFCITECGYCVNFPISYPIYTAPECFIIEYFNMNKNKEYSYGEYWKINNPKIDVYSLGVVMLQFIYAINIEIFEKISVKIIVKNMIELIRRAKIDQNLDAYSYYIQLFKIEAKKKELIESKWKSIISLIKLCLKVNVKERATAEQLLNHLNSFQDTLKHHHSTETKNSVDDQFKNSIFNRSLRSSLITVDKNKKTEQNLFAKDYYNLWMNGIDQVYYLWRLTGVDCIQILRQNNNHFLFQLPSIIKTSKLFTVENSFEYGLAVNYENAFDDNLLLISLDQLKDRINSIKVEKHFNMADLTLNGEKNSMSIAEQQQPLNIRETDIEYQYNRISLFSRFLYAYPFKKNELYKECQIDIPPHYRALAWASLLNVKDDIEELYENINKEIITPTDRQIEVDIPRCHQYDALIASPDAHNKLKRVLKAWVLSNDNLVYWQGIDSLSAPFVYLNFNNESLAYGCLQNFVQKYAKNFFIKDNSNVIHEYLASFSHLTAFHDPELASHFETIDFRPDLYAIPWYLTMFAHVFPLHKIFHLWDTLLLCNPEFPICIGAAILKQLRTILLNSDFNECILLFSELPEINIQKCVTDSLNIFHNTPSTCLYLRYLNGETEDNLEMATVNLSETKNEPCPRIGLKNLLSIIDSNLLVIDIRNNSGEDKLSRHKNVYKFENLNNFKLKGSFKSNDKLNLHPNENEAVVNLINIINQNPSYVKAIVSNKIDTAVQLANSLIKLGYPKICIEEADFNSNQTAATKQITVELTKQNLNTILNGLSKIKEQLKSIS